MNKQIRHASLCAFIAGICTFASLIWMITAAGGVAKPATFPNEARFTQAVFWFELASSGEEIMQVLGDPATETGKKVRAAMDATHRIDFIFMVCYSAFFAALFFLMYRLNAGTGTGGAKILLYTGIALSLVMLVSDIFETRILLAFSALPDPAKIGDAILPLQVWTRAKSGALNAAGLLIAYAYLRYFRARPAGMVLAAFFVAGAVAGTIAISVHGLRHLVEYAGSIGMIGWLLALLHAGMVLFGKTTMQGMVSNHPLP